MTDSLILPPNPTLKDFHDYIRKMSTQRNYNQTDPILDMLFLTEEIGELASAIRRTSSKGHADKNKIKENDVAGEMADCFIFLLNLANMYDINLEDAFRKKEEKNKKRVWIKNNL
ncbi:MAG: MazG nucleotide pyrophosphohydrolase domain-containing protein [Alphaproteobacteria bacterium]